MFTSKEINGKRAGKRNKKKETGEKK
jgi:hypothetical protein